LSLNGSFPFSYLWLARVGGSGGGGSLAGGGRWTVVVGGQVVSMMGVGKNCYYIRWRREK